MILFLFSCYIVDNFSFMHHDQAVAVRDGIFHIMCYHHCSQLMLLNDLIGDGKHLRCSFRVKCCSMLVQK